MLAFKLAGASKIVCNAHSVALYRTCCLVSTPRINCIGNAIAVLERRSTNFRPKSLTFGTVPLYVNARHDEDDMSHMHMALSVIYSERPPFP